MPRRATIQPRALEPDPVHGSRLVTQVINKVMTDGKKSTAEATSHRVRSTRTSFTTAGSSSR